MSQIKTTRPQDEQKIRKQQQLIRSLQQQIRQRCQSYLLQINRLKRKQQKSDHYTIQKVIDVKMHLQEKLPSEYQNEIKSLEKQEKMEEINPNGLPADIIQSYKDRISLIQQNKNIAVKQLRVFMIKCQEQEQEILKMKQELINSQKEVVIADSQRLINDKCQKALKIIQSQLSDMAQVQSQYIASIKDPIQKANIIVEKLKNQRTSESNLESEIRTYHIPQSENITTNQQESEIDKLKRQILSSQSQIKSLREQRQLYLQTNNNLQFQNQKLQKLINQIARIRDQAVERRQQLQDQYKNLQVQFTKQKNDLSQVSQLNKMLEKEKKSSIVPDGQIVIVKDQSKLQHETQVLFQQINQKQEELNQKQQKLLLSIQALKKENNELILKNETLRTDLTKANQYNMKLINQIEGLSSVKIQKQNEISQLKLAMTKLQQSVSNNMSQIQLIDKYTSIEQENARLKNQLKQQHETTNKPYNQSLEPYIIEEDLGCEPNDEYVKRRFIRKTVIRRNLSAMTFRSVSKTKKQTIQQLQKKIQTIKANEQGSPNDKQQMERFARKISNLKRNLENQAIQQRSKQDSQFNRNSNSISESSNDEKINIVELRTDVPIRSFYTAKIVESVKMPQKERTNRLYNFNKKDKNDKKGGSGLL